MLIYLFITMLILLDSAFFLYLCSAPEQMMVCYTTNYIMVYKFDLSDSECHLINMALVLYVGFLRGFGVTSDDKELLDCFHLLNIFRNKS